MLNDVAAVSLLFLCLSLWRCSAPASFRRVKNLRRKRKVSGWNAFLLRHGRGGHVAIRALAVAWRGLTEVQRHDYERGAAIMNEGRDNETEQPVCQPCDGPLNLGDVRFPIAPSLLPKSSCLANPHAVAWKKRVGSYFRPSPDEQVMAPAQGPLCQSIYGLGRCAVRLSDEEKTRHEFANGLLKKTVYDKYIDETFSSFHAGTSRLLLYYISYASQDGTCRAGVLALQLSKSLSPVVSIFHVQEIGGDELRRPVVLDLKVANLFDNVNLAARLSSFDDLKFEKVWWELDLATPSLCHIRIRHMHDVTDELRHLGKRKPPQPTDGAVNIVMSLLQKKTEVGTMGPADAHVPRTKRPTLAMALTTLSMALTTLALASTSATTSLTARLLAMAAWIARLLAMAAWTSVKTSGTSTTHCGLRRTKACQLLCTTTGPRIRSTCTTKRVKLWVAFALRLTGRACRSIVAATSAATLSASDALLYMRICLIGSGVA